MSEVAVAETPEPVESEAGSTPQAAKARTPKRIGHLLAAAYMALVFVITVIVPVLPLADPADQKLRNSLGPISGAHWLGTDQLGRDLFSRLLWGVHTSTIAVLIAVMVAVVIGLPLGLLAGYRRGWLDQLLARCGDLVLAIPALILLLAARAALDIGLQGEMVVLGIVFAPRILRIVRTETIRLGNAPFVIAGRMSGCSHTRVIRRYLMPGVRAQLVVQTSYLLGLSYLVEAGISFLGVGARPPTASLGSLLTNASVMLSSDPRVVIIPAVVLTLVVLSLNVLGDGLTGRSTR